MIGLFLCVLHLESGIGLCSYVSYTEFQGLACVTVSLTLSAICWPVLLCVFTLSDICWSVILSEL